MIDMLWGLLLAILVLGAACLAGLVVFVIVAAITAPGDSFDE